MLYIVVMNYESSEVVFLKARHFNTDTPSEKVEAFLCKKGYKLSQIYYMSGAKPITVRTPA